MSQYAFAPLAEPEARVHLTRLLEGYQLGLQTPLSLLPKTGWAWLSRCYRDGAIADDAESQQKPCGRYAIVIWADTNITVKGRPVFAAFVR
ncbi:hypothetical protein PCI56_21920 [Plesiomonas shigelloides subsp. oncorhynchi]|nr:hypothetical protein [Plesiomonas shigelloides]